MNVMNIRGRIKPPHLGRASLVTAVFLIVALIGAMAAEPTRQLLAQRERIAGMTRDLRAVERSNERLTDRIARLNDPDFIEQRAREQIGLVREGETTYVVMPPSAKKRVEKKRRKARIERKQKTPPPVHEPGFVEGVLDFVGL